MIKTLFYNLYLKKQKQFFKLQKPVNLDLKRILHLNEHDYYGGASILAHNLSSELNKLDYSSAMLVSEKSTSDRAVYKIQDSFFQRILQIGAYSKWRDFLNLSSLSIPEMECFQEADIIHAHNLHSHYFNPFLLPYLSSLKPIIWTLHDTEELIFPCLHRYVDCDNWQNDCSSCPQKLSLKKVKHSKEYFQWEHKKDLYQYSRFSLVAPSKWIAQKINKSFLNEHPVYQIYNGVNTDIFKRTKNSVFKEKFNIPEGKKILLFVAEGGIHNPDKGGKIIPQIAELLKNKNTDFFFFIIGGKSYAELPGFGCEIPFTKDPKVLAEYYSIADLFIYPSLNDNCPLVVLEAMACGVPIITYNTGGIPELVAHLETGFIAEKGNIPELVSGISLFIKNDELLAKASNQGISRIKKDFTIEKRTKQYLELYNKLFQAYRAESN